MVIDKALRAGQTVLYPLSGVGLDATEMVQCLDDESRPVHAYRREKTDLPWAQPEEACLVLALSLTDASLTVTSAPLGLAARTADSESPKLALQALANIGRSGGRVVRWRTLPRLTGWVSSTHHVQEALSKRVSFHQD